MENFDYYTVMESRIKYYARKYDPMNKLDQFRAPRILDTSSEPVLQSSVELKPKVKNKLRKKIDHVIALFL